MAFFRGFTVPCECLRFMGLWVHCFVFSDGLTPGLDIVELSRVVSLCRRYLQDHLVSEYGPEFGVRDGVQVDSHHPVEALDVVPVTLDVRHQQVLGVKVRYTPGLRIEPPPADLGPEDGVRAYVPHPVGPRAVGGGDVVRVTGLVAADDVDEHRVGSPRAPPLCRDLHELDADVALPSPQADVV